MLGSIYTAGHGQVWRQAIGGAGGQGANMNVCQNVLDHGYGTGADIDIGDPTANPVRPGTFAYTGCEEIPQPLKPTTLLRVITTADGEFTAVSDPDGYTLSDPSWSPDGGEIVYVRDHRRSQVRTSCTSCPGTARPGAIACSTVA